MNRSSGWKFVRSLWILLTFTWFLNWIAFLYTGLKVQKSRWIGWSMVYFFFSAVVPIVFINNRNNNFYIFLMLLSMVLWGASIIHAFIIRKEYIKLIDLKEQKDIKYIPVEENVSSAADKDAGVRDYLDDIGSKLPKVSIKKEYEEKIKNFGYLIREINNKKALFSSEALSKTKYMIIERFFNGCKDELMLLNDTYEKYVSGFYLINKHDNIEKEIKELEEKINKSSNDVKALLEKTLSEKQSIKQEYEKVKTYLETSETKVNYLLSILEKIEIIIETDLINDKSDNRQTEEFESKLSVFSDNLKSALKSLEM